MQNRTHHMQMQNSHDKSVRQFGQNAWMELLFLVICDWFSSSRTRSRLNINSRDEQKRVEGVKEMLDVILSRPFLRWIAIHKFI